MLRKWFKNHRYVQVPPVRLTIDHVMLTMSQYDTVIPSITDSEVDRTYGYLPCTALIGIAGSYDNT